jgi:hypothetical protein
MGLRWMLFCIIVRGWIDAQIERLKETTWREWVAGLLHYVISITIAILIVLGVQMRIDVNQIQDDCAYRMALQEYRINKAWNDEMNISMPLKMNTTMGLIPIVFAPTWKYR